MTDLAARPQAAESVRAPRRWSSNRVVVHEPETGFRFRLTPLRDHLHMAAHFGHNYLRKYYQDTFLGLLWLPLRPLSDTLLGTLLFGGFLQVASGGKPYMIFLVVGSIGWVLFERMVYWGYRSLQYNQRYFRAIAVPWLPAVTGTIIPGLLQAFLYFVIAVGVAIYFLAAEGHFYLHFGASTLYVLLGIGLLVPFGWIFGLIFGPVVRLVRDVRMLLPFPLAFLNVLTPVVYPISTMPKKYQAIAIYNPLTAPVEFIRHGFLGMGLPATASVITTVAVLVVGLPVSVLLFIRSERRSHERL